MSARRPDSHTSSRISSDFSEKHSEKHFEVFLNHCLACLSQASLLCENKQGLVKPQGVLDFPSCPGPTSISSSLRFILKSWFFVSGICPLFLRWVIRYFNVILCLLLGCLRLIYWFKFSGKIYRPVTENGLVGIRSNDQLWGSYRTPDLAASNKTDITLL
jgi:hypothetical protein